MHIEENVPLAPYTTLKIGGPARYFVPQGDEENIGEACRLARDKGVPFFLLGGGSNLVVSDAGFPGLVFRMANAGKIHTVEHKNDDAHFVVDAAVEWDRLVRYVCEQGLSGMECLAGIPGTVGAAPVQNIGAYGQEVSQTIEFLRVCPLASPADFKRIDFVDCQFGYRRSIFNSTRKDQFAILSVGFRVSRKAKPNLAYPDLKKRFEGKPSPTPLEVYHAVRAIRATKGMLIEPGVDEADTRSAGSFFKNPVVPLASLGRIARHLGIAVEQIQHWPLAAQPEASDLGGTVPEEGSSGQTKLPAAWLIERAGFPKGFRLGPASISTRHTLALTNHTGTATCADLLRLRDHMVAGVESAFGITLEQEPVYLR